MWLLLHKWINLLVTFIMKIKIIIFSIKEALEKVIMNAL